MSPIKSLFIAAFRGRFARVVVVSILAALAMAEGCWAAKIFLASIDNDKRSDSQIMGAARKRELQARADAANAEKFGRLALQKNYKPIYRNIEPSLKDMEEIVYPVDEDSVAWRAYEPALAIALSRNLKSDKLTDIFTAGRSVGALGQRGEITIRYNRRREMLSYHAWSSSMGVGYMEDWTDIYSGVSESVIHRLARDKKPIIDLAQYGCTKLRKTILHKGNNQKSTP